MRTRKKGLPKSHSPPRNPPDWAQLLVDAVEKPGIISAGYSTFWNYSTGNQLLALFQCLLRKIEPGPIHTFQGWKSVAVKFAKGRRPSPSSCR